MSKYLPQEEERLELKSCRFFPSIWKSIEKATRNNQDRWENESQFVRAACIHYLNYLESQRVTIVARGRPKKVRP